MLHRKAVTQVASSSSLTNNLWEHADSLVDHSNQSQLSAADHWRRRARAVRRWLDRARDATEHRLPEPGLAWRNSSQDYVSNLRQNLMHLDAINWFKGYLLCMSQPQVQEFWELPNARQFCIFLDVLLDVAFVRRDVPFGRESTDRICGAYAMSFQAKMTMVVTSATSQLFADLPFQRD